MQDSPNVPAPEFSGFPSRMSRGEALAAAIWLPLHAVLLPLLLNSLPMSIIEELGVVLLNVAYYAASALGVFILLRRFLRRDFDTLLDHPGRGLLSVASGYVMSFALAYILTLVIYALGLEVSATANNDLVMQYVRADYDRMFVAVVVLAPLAEEPLFRGLLFGRLAQRSRAAAYAVSMLVFALYHVWQYAVADPGALLDVVNYLPISFALAWCYERSGSIWSPIAMHALNNAISLAVLNS